MEMEDQIITPQAVWAPSVSTCKSTGGKILLKAATATVELGFDSSELFFPSLLEFYCIATAFFLCVGGTQYFLPGQTYSSSRRYMSDISQA